MRPKKKITVSDVMHGLVMVVGVEAFIITMTSKFYCFYLEKKMNCIIKADDRAGRGGRGRGGLGFQSTKGKLQLKRI